MRYTLILSLLFAFILVVSARNIPQYDPETVAEFNAQQGLKVISPGAELTIGKTNMGKLRRGVSSMASSWGECKEGQARRYLVSDRRRVWITTGLEDGC
jgi:hypothetical protein